MNDAIANRVYLYAPLNLNRVDVRSLELRFVRRRWNLARAASSYDIVDLTSFSSLRLVLIKYKYTLITSVAKLVD